MKPFAYQSLASVDELSGGMPVGVQFYAGGTDLLTRMKVGLVRPDQLLDIKQSGLPRDIELQGQTMRLGSLITLTDIERYDFLPEHALLADAARQAATPQLRNRATLGGTLCQRPRCWYYRNPSVNCWLKGASACPAKDGRNEHHALFGASHCVAVHPSDLASCRWCWRQAWMSSARPATAPCRSRTCLPCQDLIAGGRRPWTRMN